LAALDLGAGVEQPVDCLIVQNRQPVQSMVRSTVSPYSQWWGLDTGTQPRILFGRAQSMMLSVTDIFLTMLSASVKKTGSRVFGVARLFT